MARDRRVVGKCSQCQGDLACSYNHFENASEQIDSWEHRCLSCNVRETRAVRTPAGQTPETNPRQCPFCGRSGEPM